MGGGMGVEVGVEVGAVEGGVGVGGGRGAYPAQQHLSLLVDGQRWNVVELKHGQQFGSDPGGLALRSFPMIY